MKLTLNDAPKLIGRIFTGGHSRDGNIKYKLKKIISNKEMIEITWISEGTAKSAQYSIKSIIKNLNEKNWILLEKCGCYVH
jgi:hypothetical protein